LLQVSQILPFLPVGPGLYRQVRLLDEKPSTAQLSGKAVITIGFTP
jgi:hypothetical protein